MSWARHWLPRSRKSPRRDTVSIWTMFYHLTMVDAGYPEWIVPMAATLTQQRFTGPEWLFERKFDGIRLLAFKRGGEVRLFSRNRLPQTCPPIASAVAALPPS